MFVFVFELVTADIHSILYYWKLVIYSQACSKTISNQYFMSNVDGLSCVICTIKYTEVAVSCKMSFFKVINKPAYFAAMTSL